MTNMLWLLLWMQLNWFSFRTAIKGSIVRYTGLRGNAKAFPPWGPRGGVGAYIMRV